MSKKEMYFLDTIKSIKNYDIIEGAFSLNYYHSYNVVFPLKYPLKNLRKITLKSVEMPLSIPMIRLNNKSNTIGITFDTLAGTYYVVCNIPANNYTMTSLIDMINSQLTNGPMTAYQGTYITFSTIAVPYGYICSILNNCLRVTLDSTPLVVYILGYSNSLTNSIGRSVQGSSPINLYAIDTCLYMNITNLPVMNNNNSQSSTFKIPIDNLVNGTLFYNDAAEHQSVSFNNSTFLLDKLNIVLYDRLGFQLCGYMNWTMTLLIEYDDNYAVQEQFLNINN